MATRKQEVATLAKLMKKIDIAMLATIGKGGYLVSRPLSTQAATFDGEHIWFMTRADSPKVAEIRRNARVNVAYASKDANTYISASGDARAVRDQALIDRLWNDALKAFFPKGPNDPNLTLIEVRVRTIEYWDGPGSWIGKAATYLAALVTGNDDLMGENRIVDLATGRSRKPPGADRPSGKPAPTPKPDGTRARGAKSPAATKKTATRKSPAKKTAARKSASRKPATKKAAKATKKAAAR
jgi:general stress protein 26